ncbi:uncharacterized protein WM277_013179 isoform 1-T5 [Molossus nigricans]
MCQEIYREDNVVYILLEVLNTKNVECEDSQVKEQTKRKQSNSLEIQRPFQCRKLLPSHQTQLETRRQKGMQWTKSLEISLQGRKPCRKIQKSGSGRAIEEYLAQPKALVSNSISGECPIFIQ